MNEPPQREQVIGQTIVGITHSPYSEPVSIREGIGPASFRSHYVTLTNGIVLDLFTAELLITVLPAETMPGETTGLPLQEVLGRRIVAVARDDVYGVILILEGGLYLKDDNDGFYGNPMLAVRLDEHYTSEELKTFLDYWSEQPLRLNAS